jgi:hypothetical protein
MGGQARSRSGARAQTAVLCCVAGWVSRADGGRASEQMSGRASEGVSEGWRQTRRKVGPVGSGDVVYVGQQQWTFQFQGGAAGCG